MYVCNRRLCKLHIKGAINLGKLSCKDKRRRTAITLSSRLTASCFLPWNAIKVEKLALRKWPRRTWYSFLLSPSFSFFLSISVCVFFLLRAVIRASAAIFSVSWVRGCVCVTFVIALKIKYYIAVPYLLMLSE